MKKVDAVLLKVFLFGLPLLIVYAVFFYAYTMENAAMAGGLVEWLYNFGGLVFGALMALSVYLSFRLLVSGTFRETVLARLTLMRERDEREAMLTGKAAKTAMLTSLAILIFLFCLSCFQVSVSTLPPELAVDGKNKMISLGLSFNLLENAPPKVPGEGPQRGDIVSYTGLPFSSTAVILGLIVWQIIAYNYAMRRMLR